MQLCEFFLKLPEESFAQLVRGISLGKLRTYQLYEPFKARAHMTKLNTENLRKAIPRFRARLASGEEEFAKELAQAILVCHLDMAAAVLDFLGIPNQDGFFSKDLDASQYLSPGWQQRVWDNLRDKYPAPVLLLHLNHLAWELDKLATCFFPTEAESMNPV
jgi:hypothetical protein